ncbi:hypothetical protein A8135_05675 [Legionella jamestowniensis]|uniref:Ankyrin repeat protein n=1 Tax=Legionella jamestowniensis TaxID=455 RepID=A0ABX2XR84_9GAMM|nr:hypothetical protein [Legionella jamestowniensis]OCH97118.1 hypothetical protein A8135_05675 [Legionella jamestowniensis]
MWYLDLMLPLLAKVKIADRQKAAILLENFLKQLKQEFYFEENSIPVAPMIQLIDSSYSAFKDTQDNSLSLIQFANVVFPRALLYVKVSEDLVTWNSDFLSVVNKVKNDLGWDSEIKELTCDFASGQKKLNSKTYLSDEDKAIVYLLNKKEIELLQALEYQFNANFFDLEIIFRRCGTAETLEAFRRDSVQLENSTSRDFNDLVGFLTLPSLIQRMKETAALFARLEYDNSTLVSLAKTLEAQEQELNKEFKKLSPDVGKIAELKKIIKENLQEQTEQLVASLSNDLQAMRLFHHAFAPHHFLFPNLVQQIDDQLKLKNREIKAIFPEDIAKLCLDILKVECELLEDRLDHPNLKLGEKNKSSEDLLQSLEILLDRSPLKTRYSFVKYFEKLPVFSTVVMRQKALLQLNPLSQCILKIKAFAEQLDSPHKEKIQQFATQEQERWESSDNPADAAYATGMSLAEAFYNELLAANSWELLQKLKEFAPSFAEKEDVNFIFEAILNRNNRNLAMLDTHEIATAIKQMEVFANTTSLRKRSAINDLVPHLKTQWQNLSIELIKPSPDNNKVQHLKSNFVTLLHSKDELINEHRDPFWQIVLNLMFALTGVGALAIAGKTVYSSLKDQQLSINSCLFFAKTASQEKIETIEEKVISVTA